MSRNFTEYAKHIFNLLSEGVNASNVDKMRILENLDESAKAKEKDFFLRSSNLEFDYILNNVKVGKFSYDNDEYLLITQVDVNDSATKEAFNNLEGSEIFEHEINAGMFLFLVKDADLQRISPLSLTELEQNIFFDQYDVNYQGHNFSDLMEFIENFTVLKIDANSAFSGRNYIEIGYFICSQFGKFIRLPTLPLINDYKAILHEQSAVLKENVFPIPDCNTL